MQTGEHVSRLEEVFESIGKKVQAKKCKAMEGLTKEGESIIEETGKGSMTRDVGIISQTLEEEKQTDRGLTDIAESRINREAEQEDVEA